MGRCLGTRLYLASGRQVMGKQDSSICICQYDSRNMVFIQVGLNFCLGAALAGA